MKNELFYINKLNTLKEEENYRILPQLVADPLLDLSSNDYLGLANNPVLKKKFFKSIDLKQTKFSASSSRLLSGNSNQYTRLENFLASLYKREACLIYNSGYHANIGILPALVQKNDLVITDKLVHASILDGMGLCQAETLRFNHLDYDHLEKLLVKKAPDCNNIFIVSESIFSMDGDKADIEKLVAIKNKFDAYLYIDEAHAVGVLGKNGLGLADECNLIKEVDFIVGTFGKALASVGAFVICSEVFRQFLINHSRTLIFTTALPPINLAWTNFILENLLDFDERRDHLKELSIEFGNLLGIKYNSHILPFILGDNKKAIRASQLLSNEGFNVLPIRYPTVPKGTARLRFSLNANMQIKQLIHIKDTLNLLKY